MESFRSKRITHRSPRTFGRIDNLISTSISSLLLIKLIAPSCGRRCSAIFNSDYQEVRAIEAQVLDENSFSEYLKERKVYFIGNGVKKTMDLITNKNAVFIEEKLPSANQMSLLSFEAYKKSNIQDVAYFEPFYLKDFVAVKSKK